MDRPIRIRGARQHNLKGIDLDLPRGLLTVITGPSGSGKSSLALDTLFAAGQRRYVEALSTYARQFLERLDKPDVDRIEGISPAVAIEQRNPTTSSRSTVGTATEIHDFLRLLFARVGRTICPDCGDEVRPDSVTSAVDRLAALSAGRRIMIGFPLVRSERATHRALAGNLRALGFGRVIADGASARIDALLAEDGAARREDAGDGARAGDSGARRQGEDRPREGPDDDADARRSGRPRKADAGRGRAPRDAGEGTARRGGPDLAAAREVIVVVDRVKAVSAPDRSWRDRVADALATCLREGEGEAVAVLPGGGEEDDRRIAFSERFRCPCCPERSFLEPEPRLFSFNNPYGSCPDCTGFGATLEYDPALIVPDEEASLSEGAVDPWAKPRYDRERDLLRRFALDEGVSWHAPWRRLPDRFRRAVLHGKGEFQGILDFLASKESMRYKRYIRVFLRRYQRPMPCRACRGTRLRPEAGWVTVGGLRIGQVAELPVARLREWLEGLELRPMEEKIAATLLRELRARVGFLVDVGLEYLTLGRQTRTLSGGEAQRISLANALGARLVDTLYVLDEPSVGLHPADIDALLALLRRLRDGGNTVVVVEHNAAAIRAADHVVEMGPGSGDLGGEIVFEGPPAALAERAGQRAHPPGGRGGRRTLAVHEAADKGAATGGRWPMSAATRSRNRRARVDGARIVVRGATLHNLRDVDAEFPLHALNVVTGVSGSGKSTLVHDVLFRALERELGQGRTSAREHLGEAVGSWRAITGLERIDDVALVDQSPIGRTPRSNPVTYMGAWGEIRRIFASQPEARRAGLAAGSFSFNVSGGRCEACAGAGFVRVEMVFMADVHVRCEHCGGRRYRREVLAVRVRGRTIADILEFTVDRAIRFFLREPKLGQALWHLQQVGLGYVRLGQPATHLSGGEAQRLKIARELAGAATRRGKRKLYILDEPTTGLSAAEVVQLVAVLRKLVAAGHTLIVIEHDLDVIREADWVVDMGPGAGPNGGQVVAMGRPEEVATAPASATGRFLAAELGVGGG